MTDRENQLTQVGTLSTPAYLFNPEQIIQNYRDLKERLQTKLIVSVKANPNFELLLRCAHAFEDGVDLASIGELELAVGRQQGERFVNSPAMDADFLRAAVASRATLILDNVAQANAIAAMAERGLKIKPSMLRVNIGALLGPNAQRPSDHFGMSPEDLLTAALTLKQAGVDIRGLHAFSGSRRFSNDGVAIARAFPDLIARVESALSESLSLISLGGGFPEDWRCLDFAPYLEALLPLKDRYDVAHEAGRAIFANAGQFATRVIAVKEFDEHVVAICDGGMAQNFLLAQTEAFTRKMRKPRFVPLREPEGEILGKPILIVGSTCNRNDRIGAFAEGGPRPQSGDLYIFEDCGAYNATYTVSGFLSSKQAHSYIGALQK